MPGVAAASGAPAGSLAAIAEAFFSLEAEQGLYEQRLAGEIFWPLLRVHAYYAAARATGLMGASITRRRGLAGAADLARTTAAGVLGGNPLLHRGRHGTLVFPHPRKTLGAAGWTDQNAAPLLAELAGSDALVVDRLDPSLGAIAVGYTLPAVRREALDLSARASMALRRLSLTTPEQQLLAMLGERLRRDTGASLDLAALARRNLVKFQAQRRLFRRLVQRFGARQVFLVVAYTNEGLVAGARDAGARVYELQHGLISPYHLGYHYPGRPDLPAAPDGLLTYGPAWTERVALPRRTATAVIGSAAHRSASTPGIARDPSQILFISQGTIALPLARFAVAVARLLPDRRVLFRLHPGQDRAGFAAQLASECQTPGNFAIGTAERPIAEALGASTLQAGVYSTALLEGMTLGCRTLLVDLPGIENLAAALARGDAQLVRSPEAFAAAADQAPLATSRDAYYAAPVESILKTVQQLEQASDHPASFATNVARNENR